MAREIRVFDSREAAWAAEIAERSRMTREERLAVGAELHAFGVRNYFPDATRLDRVVQVVQRPRLQDLADVEALEAVDDSLGDGAD